MAKKRKRRFSTVIRKADAPQKGRDFNAKAAKEQRGSGGVIIPKHQKKRNRRSGWKKDIEKGGTGLPYFFVCCIDVSHNM